MRWVPVSNEMDQLIGGKRYSTSMASGGTIDSETALSRHPLAMHMHTAFHGQP